MTDQKNTPEDAPKSSTAPEGTKKGPERPKEFGGRKGPEPTRYGDWENNGIASDF